MADEITLNIRLKFVKSPQQTVEWAEEELSIDVTGNALIQNVQNVGTTAEALVVGDLAFDTNGSTGDGTIGWGVFKNLDTTNYIQIGHTGVAADKDYLVQLLAGETCAFRLNAFQMTSIKVIADTAACDLQYLLIEA